MTIRRVGLTAVLVVTGLLMAGGCASQGGTGSGSGPGPHPLTPTEIRVYRDDEWWLTRMVENGAAVPLVAQSRVTLIFQGPDRVGGLASINRYFGDFTLGPEGRITWQGTFGMTRMAGPPGLMTQETRFLQLLGKTTRARIDGPRLILDDGGPSTILEFSRPNRPRPRMDCAPRILCHGVRREGELTAAAGIIHGGAH
jgi:heat shock protein HslJ